MNFATSKYMFSRERGGLGEESLNPEREVGVLYLPRHERNCCLGVEHKQAFGAFKAVRHRMVENYLGIEQN